MFCAAERELIDPVDSPSGDQTINTGATMATKKTDEPEATKVTGPASYFPSIEKKHGQPITYWQNLIRDSPLDKHMALVNWLKSEHGMGHGHANAVVAYTLAEK